MLECGHVGGNEPVDVGRSGPRVWAHLMDAERAGVAFIDAQGRPGLVVMDDDNAEFGLDVSRADDGRLLVSEEQVLSSEVSAEHQKAQGGPQRCRSATPVSGMT